MDADRMSEPSKIVRNVMIYYACDLLHWIAECGFSAV